ncbi:MAG: HlyD family type I secretion periplasmic adaptor subunit [Pseudomonadota bacterium]
MTPAKNIVRFPLRPKPFRPEETAFLPAALEIVETPASPVARAISASIIAVFCAALVWASLGHVDIVAVAPGKIVPNGRTKIIQPLEAGVVRAIHVHDGSIVKAGDVLIELDPTINAAEAQHMKIDLMATRLDIARLRAALTGHDDPLAAFAPPQDAADDLVAAQRQVLLTQTREQRAKIAEIDRQIAQKGAERATIAATVAKLEATTPVLEERANLRKYLYDTQLGSKLTYLSELQDLVGQRHEILVQQSRKGEADAAVATLTESRARAEAEYQHVLSDDLAKAEQKAAGLGQEVIKAEQKARQQALSAPIDGVVQQLAVHTIGGVVTPAQNLAVIVASHDGVEIDAMVSNRDIGYVTPGQSAEIKVDTFDFTRYGLLHGRITNVSRDAMTTDRPRDPSSTADTAKAEPKAQDLTYAARIALDRTDMLIDGGLVPLAPGMAVTAEIKTGSRRIISYLLSPLVRYQHDVLRER